MYKGIGKVEGGGVGCGGGWAAADRPYLLLGLFKEVPAIGPDKPGGPKKHLTNTGANGPYCFGCDHMVSKSCSRKADQLAKSGNTTVNG